MNPFGILDADEGRRGQTPFDTEGDGMTMFEIKHGRCWWWAAEHLLSPHPSKYPTVTHPSIHTISLHPMFLATVFGEDASNYAMIGWGEKTEGAPTYATLRSLGVSPDICAPPK